MEETHGQYLFWLEINQQILLGHWFYTVYQHIILFCNSVERVCRTQESKCLLYLDYMSCMFNGADAKSGHAWS